MNIIASEKITKKTSEARKEAYVIGSQKIGRSILKRFGDTLKIDLTEMEAYSLLTFYDQIFVNDQYSANRLIKSGDVVLDCGANCGVFSILASEIVGNGGKVFAFEPVERTYSLLKYFTKDKNNIHRIKKGVYNYTGMCKINISPVHAQNSLAIDYNYGSEDIQVITIDAFVKEHNIGRVHLIKMDIEGSEKEALKGAMNTISQYKPILVICTYHLSEDKKAVPALIKEICEEYVFTEVDDILFCTIDGEHPHVK